MNILGLDYGLKKVGVAWAQSGWVEPIDVWPNNSLLIPKIASVCINHQIDQIIVGQPEGPLQPLVIDFSQSLRQQLNLPVDLYDESLTSHEAIAKMNQAHKKRQYKKQHEDAFAAAVLLQNYLEANQRRLHV